MWTEGDRVRLKAGCNAGWEGRVITHFRAAVPVPAGAVFVERYSQARSYYAWGDYHQEEARAYMVFWSMPEELELIERAAPRVSNSVSKRRRNGQ